MRKWTKRKMGLDIVGEKNIGWARAPRVALTPSTLTERVLGKQGTIQIPWESVCKIPSPASFYDESRIKNVRTSCRIPGKHFSHRDLTCTVQTRG